MIDVNAPIDPDAPFLILCEEMTRETFQRRYHYPDFQLWPQPPGEGPAILVEDGWPYPFNLDLEEFYERYILPASYVFAMQVEATLLAPNPPWVR